MDRRSGRSARLEPIDLRVSGRAKPAMKSASPRTTKNRVQLSVNSGQSGASYVRHQDFGNYMLDSLASAKRDDTMRKEGIHSRKGTDKRLMGAVNGETDEFLGASNFTLHSESQVCNSPFLG